MHHYCKSCNEDNNYNISILDENNIIYINCYPECKYNYYFNKSDHYNYTCTETSDCPQSYPFLLENAKQCIESCDNITNIWQFRRTCFEQCPYDSYNYTNETGFYCNASCLSDSPFEMTKTQYCVSSCTIMERYDKLCFTNYDGVNNSKVQDMVLKDFKDDIIDTFDYSSIINENHSLIHKEKSIIYEITSTNNTQNVPTTTIIDLGECEYILKDYYGINRNESLYIFKFDAFVEGKAGPKVEYEIYYPFDGMHLRLLDVSICEGKEIFIGYHLDISKDELDLYNSNSDFYHDICYPYTNSKGTDVTLNDRQIEFLNNNKSLCDEDCKFNGYDEQKERFICSCEIKYTISMISDIKVDKNKLFKFISLKQLANFSVMKCIKLLFSIKGIQTNIGFYSFFPTIIAYITALFLLYVKELKRIMKQIDEIISVKKLLRYLKFRSVEINKKINKLSLFHGFIDHKKINLGIFREETPKNKQNIENNNDIKISSKINQKEISEDTSYIQKIEDSGKNHKNKNIVQRNKKNELDEKVESNISSRFLIKSFKTKNKYDEKNNIRSEKQRNKDKNKDLSNRNLIELQYILEINKVKRQVLTLKEKIKILKVLKLNDTELNELGYKKAIKYDQRNFYQYYISLLFTKHILFQIFNKRDYNAYSIKVLLFFFNFSSCFAINTLFFNDNTMHQIYEDEGDFNFIYQLPQIAYSTLISFFIDNLTTFLALSEDIIIELKKDKNLENLSKKGKHIKDILKIKFIFFFIVNIILILVFWYYIGCFCAVYKNTQYHLIKDTLISFSVGCVSPFGTNALTALVRMYSLKKYTSGNKTLFRLSRILQNFL